MRVRRIAITLGDPAGIGPEIVLKSLLSKEVAEVCTPVLVGDRAVLDEAADRFGMGAVLGEAEVIAPGIIGHRGFAKNVPTEEGGRACAAYIEEAVGMALRGEVDAVVTAPISKEALKRANLPWPGHTEMLAELTGTRDFAMMLVGGPLRVILVTIHTALRNVPALVTRERVLRTITLAGRACAMMGIVSPRIAVAGLNPHAGESGIFGMEEQDSISPAVRDAQAAGIPVSGPYPADALFHRMYRGDFDIVVCMYHDQGLIPLKMIAFDRGVNITVGLPIIRTSPDHGTAYDIAWKGEANPSSMIAAIRMASVLKKI
ncbi:MAG: 4-hydroxythreonine-4-phosphate dehydrogenase PdxA [Alphaproteobacteria bacterium]|uniref:4-hydroxythreonine-4-phosphate dehydrogenase PdxA n=1 Tax=Candidatus Nitrobium versatile TaxID=2884831 RepID=A0A953M2Y5_9BACT|nr:4-hydroxythreonine-4-phosphate dehydrogenase PdxA [Candidatus Nitrobium versatile]